MHVRKTSKDAKENKTLCSNNNNKELKYTNELEEEIIKRLLCDR